MLLTLTTTNRPARGLGVLLAKHPERCTACLLLDLDPVGLVRGGRPPDHATTLAEYVNDRPYVASSFPSVAIAQVLAATPIPLEAGLSVVPCRGGEAVLRRLFEPLGYEIDAERIGLDEKFPSGATAPIAGSASGRRRSSETFSPISMCSSPSSTTRSTMGSAATLSRGFSRARRSSAFFGDGLRSHRRHGPRCRAYRSGMVGRAHGLGRRIIYGAEHTSPEHLERLRSHSLGAKRSLAVREFALGLEALRRFVENEPLYRVHECVFSVLALESEPMDPSL